MLGKRSASLLLPALLAAAMITAPAAAQAQTAGDAEEQVATFAELSANDEFEKVLLSRDVPQPMSMDIAADGRIFMTSRDGVIRVYHPNTGHVTVAAELSVFNDHPLPPNPDFEGSKNQEGGLLGLALDPDFESNGWVYVYYTSRDENNHFLSRFVLDDGVLDVSSEVVMLKVPYNKTHCCHVAGDLEFDSAGNLYLSTGDESPPDLNQQYSPLDNRPTHWYNDDRRTSGNTNDLRGKVLRITPQPDGTYTIPDGNLFTGDEDGGGKTRPEIYAMGFRNPFRISIDPETDRLHIGNYGPDRLGEWTERGPWGFDQYLVTSEPANFGYPFCIGNNYPYRPWDYVTNTPLGDFYDCENGPVNDSPNNTGLEQTPPVKPAAIYYPRSWAGWPTTWVGWPDREINPIPEPFLNMGSGAGGPMSGPVYRYDESLDSDTKFPEHYDGRWFLLDFHRGHVKSVELDEDETVIAIDDFLPSLSWLGLMDGEFGPDGSLYVLEGGAFGPNPNAGLYRIDYVGDGGPGLEECVIDDFSGTELDREMWPTIIRENPDGYRQVDGALEIDMLQGDMISNHMSGNINTDAQNLILMPVPDERWVAEVTIDLPAESVSHDQAGFIIYDDDQNFTKAAFFPPYVGQTNGRFEYLYHENGEIRFQSGVDNATLPNAPRTITLRLTSNGSDVAVAYSFDGQVWNSVGRPAPISNYDDPSFGLFAAHGPNEVENPLTATFTDFSLCLPSDPGDPECAVQQVDPGYRALWDGSTLNGWNQAGPGGFAVVADEDRVGGCALESIGDPAGLGMLWHEEEFESYRLHLDFKAVAEDDNSGVFIGFPDPGDDPWVGVNQGFEIQIDDTGGFPGAPDSSKTGAIYTFQGPTSFPAVAGEWNTMEIEVDDPMIKVWINDVLVNEFENPEGSGRDLSSGYIGIQNNRVTDNVFFRDIWIRELSDTEPCPDPDTPPAGYVSLFDGETLNGWTHIGPGGFEVGECGLLQPHGGMGLLWYHEQMFEDFVMQVDFRVQRPADNSGVFVRFPDPQGDPWNPVDEGYEIQIYDATDNPLTRTGAIYTFAPAEPLATNPIGEWNTMEIEAIGQDYRVILNGVEVTTYTGDGSRPLEGYVGLQNHAAGQAAGENVEFRNVWIKELDDDPGELTVEASLDPSDPDGANRWYVSPVTLTLESNNPDAVLQWRPRTDESEWRTWTDPVTFDEDGVYNIDYKAVLPGDDGDEPTEKEILVGVDGFSFSETEFSVKQGDVIKFQYVPPFPHDVVVTDENGAVLASRPVGSDWEDDPFYFEAVDEGTFYVYCTPHTNLVDPDDPTTWTGMVATFEVTPSGGTPPVETGIEEIEFLIDQTAPVTEASLTGDRAGEVFTGPVTVTLAADDATSGVAETHYRMAGDEDATVYDVPLTVSEPGDHVVEYRSVDVAGNVEDWQSVEFTIGDGGPCPDPDQRETVVVGDVDSGVPNYTLDDGCTVNDLILDEDDWPNRGAFLAHVRSVTGQLVDDGVITTQEQRDINRAAAQSGVGGPARGPQGGVKAV